MCADILYRSSGTTKRKCLDAETEGDKRDDSAAESMRDAEEAQARRSELAGGGITQRMVSQVTNRQLGFVSQSSNESNETDSTSSASRHSSTESVMIMGEAQARTAAPTAAPSRPQTRSSGSTNPAAPHPTAAKQNVLEDVSRTHITEINNRQ